MDIGSLKCGVRTGQELCIFTHLLLKAFCADSSQILSSCSTNGVFKFFLQSFILSKGCVIYLGRVSFPFLSSCALSQKSISISKYSMKAIYEKYLFRNFLAPKLQCCLESVSFSSLAENKILKKDLILLG